MWECRCCVSGVGWAVGVGGLMGAVGFDVMLASHEGEALYHIAGGFLRPHVVVFTVWIGVHG